MNKWCPPLLNVFTVATTPTLTGLVFKGRFILFLEQCSVLYSYFDAMRRSPCTSLCEYLYFYTFRLGFLLLSVHCTVTTVVDNSSLGILAMYLVSSGSLFPLYIGKFYWGNFPVSKSSLHSKICQIKFMQKMYWRCWSSALKLSLSSKKAVACSYERCCTSSM